MDCIKDQEKAYTFLDKIINKNKKISHAYLIETNGYNDYKVFIKYMIKSILCSNVTDDNYIKKIDTLVENDNYPDLKYIYPDGNYIKKEQILSLEEEFSKKSLLDNKLIYVIDGAEKLNDSSANTILKFLEEPEEDIIAILVTTNRYKVLETILSRCQIISLSNSDIQITIDDNINMFLSDLFVEKELIINYDLYLNSLFVDRKTAIESLEIIEQILYNYINKYKISEEIEKILKNRESKIIDYILIIDKEKSKLDYNVNIKLWLTNLIAALMEVE